MITVSYIQMFIVPYHLKFVKNCKYTVEIQQDNNSADATKSQLFVCDPDTCTDFANNIDNNTCKVDEEHSVIEEL